jgi:hypothetical protein
MAQQHQTVGEQRNGRRNRQMKLDRTTLGLTFALGCQQVGAPGAVAQAPHEAGGVEVHGLAPGKPSPWQNRECRTYATLDHGSYQLMNNMFGREQAAGPYEQCL